MIPATPSPEEPCYDVTGDGVVDVNDQAAVNNYFGQVEAFYDLNGRGYPIC